MSSSHFEWSFDNSSDRLGSACALAFALFWMMFKYVARQHSLHFRRTVKLSYGLHQTGFSSDSPVWRSFTVAEPVENAHELSGNICQNPRFDVSLVFLPLPLLGAEPERSLWANVYIVSLLRWLSQVEKFKCETEARVAKEDRAQKWSLHRRAKFTHCGKRCVCSAERLLANPDRLTLFFLNVISFVTVMCEWANYNQMKNTWSLSCLHKVRTLFVSGLPLDIKPRELYLLFRPFKVCLYVLNGWAAAIFSSFFLAAVNGTSINGDEINCSGNSPPRLSVSCSRSRGSVRMRLTCQRNETCSLYHRQNECLVQVSARRCCKGL